MRANADSKRVIQIAGPSQRDDKVPHAAASHCPHLGIVDDPATTFAFATPVNHCFSSQKPKTVEAQYQQSYCLSDRHTFCPLYQEALNTSAGSTADQDEQGISEMLPRLRKAVTAPVSRATVPLTRVLMPGFFGLLLVGLLYIGLERTDVFSSLWGGDNNDGAQQPVAEAQATDQPMVMLDNQATATPSPTSPSSTETTTVQEEATQPKVTTTPRSSPTPTLTAVISATPTQATSVSEEPSPTATMTTPTVTATRCSPPSGWATYIVQRGENLYRIGLRYNLGVSAMMESNCLSTASVYAGQTLYVPFRTPINNPSPTPIDPAPSDDPPPPPEPTATNEPPPPPPPEDTPPPPPPPTETPPPPPPPTATPPPAATPTPPIEVDTPPPPPPPPPPPTPTPPLPAGILERG